MLIIHTAKEYKDFGNKIDDDKIFDNCKSNIDMANALDEIIGDINSEDTIELTTLSKFVLTRIGILISKKYIKYRNVKIKFYSLFCFFLKFQVLQKC